MAVAADLGYAALICSAITVWMHRAILDSRTVVAVGYAFFATVMRDVLMSPERMARIEAGMVSVGDRIVLGLEFSLMPAVVFVALGVWGLPTVATLAGVFALGFVFRPAMVRWADRRRACS